MFLKRSLVWVNRMLTQRREGKPAFCQLGGGQVQAGELASVAAYAGPATAMAAAPNSRSRRSITGVLPSEIDGRRSECGREMRAFNVRSYGRAMYPKHCVWRTPPRHVPSLLSGLAGTLRLVRYPLVSLRY